MTWPDVNTRSNSNTIKTWHKFTFKRPLVSEECRNISKWPHIYSTNSCLSLHFSCVGRTASGSILKSILSSCTRRVVFITLYSCLSITQCRLTAVVSCGLTFESTDRQPPSMLCKRMRQMWRAVRQRTKPGPWLIQVPLGEVRAMPQQTGPSILPPFKQTRGQLCIEPLLCCYRRLPASPKQLLTSAQAWKLNASAVIFFSVFVMIFALSSCPFTGMKPCF